MKEREEGKTPVKEKQAKEKPKTTPAKKGSSKAAPKPKKAKKASVDE